MIDSEKHILLLDRYETISLEFDDTGRNGSACLSALGPTVADDIERQEIESLLDEFAPVVHGPSSGCTSTKPIKQKYYPVSPELAEVVLVNKNDNRYRFCVDYRKLNSVTKINATPMSHMDCILRKLTNAKYISTIDLSMAFNL